MTDIAIPNEQSNAECLTIQQQRLDPALQEYIGMLALEHPFTKDIKVDARRVVRELSDNWPRFYRYAAQECELWERIDVLVRLLPTLLTVPDILVRVSASSSPLTAAVLPEAGMDTIVATFDAASGVMKQCVLIGSGDLAPSLQFLAIKSGLLVVCQHVAPLHNRFFDNRAYNYGDSENAHSENARDPILRRGKGWDVETESVTGPPDPGLYPAFQQFSPQYPTRTQPPPEEKADEKGLGFFGKVALTGAAYAGYKVYKNHEAKKQEERRQQERMAEEQREEAQPFSIYGVLRESVGDAPAETDCINVAPENAAMTPNRPEEHMQTDEDAKTFLKKNEQTKQAGEDTAAQNHPVPPAPEPGP